MLDDGHASELIIESTWPSEVMCEHRRNMYKMDGYWIATCVPLESPDWQFVKVRAHR